MFPIMEMVDSITLVGDVIVDISGAKIPEESLKFHNANIPLFLTELEDFLIDLKSNDGKVAKWEFVFSPFLFGKVSNGSVLIFENENQTKQEQSLGRFDYSDIDVIIDKIKSAVRKYGRIKRWSDVQKI